MWLGNPRNKPHERITYYVKYLLSAYKIGTPPGTRTQNLQIKSLLL